MLLLPGIDKITNCTCLTVLNYGRDAICNMELLYSESLFNFGFLYIYIYTECVPILNVSSTTGGWGIAWTGVG